MGTDVGVGGMSTACYSVCWQIEHQLKKKNSGPAWSEPGMMVLKWQSGEISRICGPPESCKEKMAACDG